VLLNKRQILGGGAKVQCYQCMRHFGPRIKICFECVKNVEPLYIRYSNGMKVLGKRLTKQSKVVTKRVKAEA